MSDYRGSTVVVSGGAGELGEPIVRRFIREGATVIVADVRAQQGHELARRLGDRCHFVALDVTDEGDWQKVLGLLQELDQPFTALIQCAGILEVGSIAEQEPSVVRRIIDTNLFGTWLGMHVLGRALRESKTGVIVNFSSTHGIYAKQNMGAYAASKWGIRGLNKTAALEFARDGIRVLSIHPGPMRTEMASIFDPHQFSTMPIPRLGEPDEVAAMVWFMATEATFSTGSEFVLDGGLLLGALAPE
jgi:3alpha(or 20beta)-hydroxysteroid dehydrogenase